MKKNKYEVSKTYVHRIVTKKLCTQIFLPSICTTIHMYNWWIFRINLQFAILNELNELKSSAKNELNELKSSAKNH